MKPLLTGDSEIDQIFKIFSLLGSPQGDMGMELQSLPLFKGTFPRFKGQDLREMIPSADEESIEFILKFLCLDRKKRISVKDALLDRIFKEI